MAIPLNNDELTIQQQEVDEKSISLDLTGYSVEAIDDPDVDGHLYIVDGAGKRAAIVTYH